MLNSQTFQDSYGQNSQWGAEDSADSLAAPPNFQTG